MKIGWPFNCSTYNNKFTFQILLKKGKFLD
jgi:hypothetical protein